jgi:hypothetical protein
MLKYFFDTFLLPSVGPIISASDMRNGRYAGGRLRVETQLPVWNRQICETVGNNPPRLAFD